MPRLAGEMLEISGLGPCSVTVMVRTGLFPHCRSRLRDTTPAPKALFLLLAGIFRKALLSADWRLPTFDECLRVHGEFVTEGSPQAAATEETAPTQMAGSALDAKGSPQTAPTQMAGAALEEQATKRRRITVKTALAEAAPK